MLLKVAFLIRNIAYSRLLRALEIVQIKQAEK